MSNAQVQQIIDWTKSGKDFVSTQAPSVVKQFLAYNIVTDWLSIFIIFVIISVFIFFIRWQLSHRELWKSGGFIYDNDLEPVFVCINVAGIIGSCVLAVFLVTNIYDLIQIHIAPKIYILNGITRLIK